MSDPLPSAMRQLLALCALAAAGTALAQSASVPCQPQATSADYRQDCGVCPEASGVAVSANYSNRSGCVGQLYDVTALTLAADPSSLNERAAAQFAAGASADDGTMIVPAPGEVRWSVVSGPVAAIAADGTATAGTVYQNTTATVRGEYSGVSGTLDVTVLNLTADDFGPYAGDGLPDDWQVANFGEGSAEAGPAADPDGDGQINLLEYLAGTKPAQASSVFTVRIQIVAGQPDRKTIVFGPVVAGRTYRVLASADLKAASWADISGALAGRSGELAFIDATAGARRFYRVQITNP